ncbi:MAG: tetratricopeptide repeat protein [Solidesulfovibrio sp. DCME]|uniref:tetratricopeptide repeat protein n=1 Tax=Solidesulfovibrio sp. DCME TaxID=3447380 RepID=UPI003D10F24C
MKNAEEHDAAGYYFKTWGESMRAKTMYDKIFAYYIEKMNGSVLVISNDNYLFRISRNYIKVSGLPDSCYHCAKMSINTFKAIGRFLAHHDHVTVLMERQLEGRLSLDDIMPLKNKFRERIKVIVLSAEVDGNTIALMYEKGADNVIIKPVSQAIIIQKIVSTLTPDNKLDALIEGCKTALQMKDAQGAESYVDKILEQRPDSTIGLMLKGDVRMLQNDNEKAKYFYTKAAVSSKFYMEPLKRLVTLYNALDDLDRKIVYLKRLDKMSPLNRERKIELANSFLSLGDNEQAYTYFEQAISLAKREANEILSKTYMDISQSLLPVDYERSLEFNNKAIKAKGKYLSKDDVWMFNEKGINLRKHQRNAEAIECFNRALRISPEDPRVNYNLGVAYAEEQEVKKAAACFDIALQYDKSIMQNSVSVAYNIGLTYYNARRFDDAYELFEAAAAIDPDNPNVAEMLQNTFKKTSRYLPE